MKKVFLVISLLLMTVLNVTKANEIEKVKEHVVVSIGNINSGLGSSTYFFDKNNLKDISFADSFAYPLGFSCDFKNNKKYIKKNGETVRYNISFLNSDIFIKKDKINKDLLIKEDKNECKSDTVESLIDSTVKVEKFKLNEKIIIDEKYYIELTEY